MSEPDHKDKKISQTPDVWRAGEGQFHVRHLINWPSGPDWHHHLSAYCEYCRREIKVFLSAPKNAPEFVYEEAKRVALIEHLRTEHPHKSKTAPKIQQKPN